MSFSKRIKHYIDYKNMSVRMFEKTCGINIGTLSRVIVKGSSIQSDNLEKIATAYNELNLEWLLTGKGEMLNIDHSSNSDSEKNKNSNRQEFFDKVLERATKEIEWQRKQIDQLTSIIKNHSESKKDFDKSKDEILSNDSSKEYQVLEREIYSSEMKQDKSNNNEVVNIVDFLRSNFKKFEIDPNKHYSEHEALRLIGAAISKGSLLQQESFLVRDTYHAIWKMIDLGFRTTAIELAEKLIPQAAYHQQFAIAQDMCSQLAFHFHLYGEFEQAQKYDEMYQKYTITVACDYKARKLYSQAIYNHKRGLPIDTAELMQMLDSIKEKLQHDSLWYQYYYYQCKTLMVEGEQLETLLKEAVSYFEDAYYCHTSFISIFTKYLIEYYQGADQKEAARVLLESKLPDYEVGSIPWFRFMMTYSLMLIDESEIQKAEAVSQKARTHSKYLELPKDRRIEWDAIVTRIKEIKITKNQ